MYNSPMVQQSNDAISIKIRFFFVCEKILKRLQTRKKKLKYLIKNKYIEISNMYGIIHLYSSSLIVRLVVRLNAQSNNKRKVYTIKICINLWCAFEIGEMKNRDNHRQIVR